MNAITEIERPQRQLSEVERVALAIAKGGLFGSSDPNAILTLCYLAQAEGQHPAVVFRDYHIIKGKPAKKAEAILRDFISAGGHVEWHTLDDECADATFSHSSGKARIDWTIARAKTAGLTTDMWRKYPRQMLRSRVISEGVRTVYPGATSGLYEENEVRDMVGPERVVEHQPEAPANDAPVLEHGCETEAPAKTPRGMNWGGRYPTKMALKKAMHVHHAELERLGVEGTFDDLEEYLSSPEYQDFVTQAGEHAPYYLDGERHPDAPEEFIQTFALEAKARDLIAIRGNIAMEAA